MKHLIFGTDSDSKMPVTSHLEGNSIKQLRLLNVHAHHKKPQHHQSFHDEAGDRL